jgi:hypothetical protein
MLKIEGTYIYADTVIKDGGNIALFIAPRPRTHMF